jgi:hypothetical protein
MFENLEKLMMLEVGEEWKVQRKKQEEICEKVLKK